MRHLRRVGRLHLHRGRGPRLHLADHDGGQRQQGRDRPGEVLHQGHEVLAELLREVPVAVPADADQVPPQQAVQRGPHEHARDVVPRGVPDGRHQSQQEHPEHDAGRITEQGDAVVVEDQETHRFLQEVESGRSEMPRSELKSYTAWSIEAENLGYVNHYGTIS